MPFPTTNMSPQNNPFLAHQLTPDVNKKVKFSHTRYKALGPQLIPVTGRPTWLPLLSARPAVTSVDFIHQMAPHSSTHPIPAYYSFIDHGRMKGWVGLVGWPVADGLPTTVVTHQLQVERGTRKVHQLETDVLPLCYATNLMKIGCQNLSITKATTYQPDSHQQTHICCFTALCPGQPG